ncbi:hypothetical protein J2853_009769 [Streptosporangium lutulentum]|uniref:Uncharacterized protein n=1 Tax=Streptosporangium lutulentum TaxID=1461250 RepID=A0ABT9QVZ4_9ACTN|nr:hypothetical protein [Streptosporangium lutulentum]
MEEAPQTELLYTSNGLYVHIATSMSEDTGQVSGKVSVGNGRNMREASTEYAHLSQGAAPKGSRIINTQL